MKYTPTALKVIGLIHEIGWDESLERLGPSRSGADSCYAGRAADEEQGAAEARSGERRRVTPVEALRGRLGKLAKDWVGQSAANTNAPDGMISKRAYLDGMRDGGADMIFYCAQMILAAIEEPESEACIDQSAPHENPAPKMPADAEPPRDERSGRRNA